MARDGGTRAFAGPPQPVEIHHRGIWYSGELLGWRHEADGRVVARVRCVVDRLRHSAWKDLADLRLPDPDHPPHRAVPATAPAIPASPDEATRPLVLLADLRSRPRKPAHALAPQLRAGDRSARPRWEPPEHHPGAGTRWDDHVERRRTYLGAV